MARKPISSEGITGRVSAEIAGKTHTGSYTVKGGWVTVSTGFGSKRAAVQEAPPGRVQPVEPLARLLLLEILGAALRSGELKD